jgi:hypothetical protein
MSGLAATDYKIGSYMSQNEADRLAAILAGDSTMTGD